MIKVKVFGTLREKEGLKEFDLDAKTPKDAIAKISKSEHISRKILKKCIFIHGDKHIKASTILNDDDELVLLSPSSCK